MKTMNVQSSKRMALGRRGYCDTSWLVLGILLLTSFSAVEAKNCSFFNDSLSKICIFSSLHDEVPVPTERVLYPAGVPLTLTCQSRVETGWILPQTFHNHKDLFAKFVKLNIIKISELNKEHNNQKLECITKNYDGRAEFKLSVISPPKLSVELLPDNRTVECKVTENWTPDLELCWIIGQKPDCQNKPRISLTLSSTQGVTKLVCGPSLRKSTNFDSLNDQAKRRFDEMFNEALVGLVVGGKVDGTQRDSPREIIEDIRETIREVKYQDQAPIEDKKDDQHERNQINVLTVVGGVAAFVAIMGVIIALTWARVKRRKTPENLENEYENFSVENNPTDEVE